MTLELPPHLDQPADQDDTGCEFGLCRRVAEWRVQPAPALEALLVCSLHVTPVLTWGMVAEAEPVIDYLGARQQQARQQGRPGWHQPEADAA